MRIPKRYGASKVDICPFCERVSTAVNEQEINVCRHHINTLLDDIKCRCGRWLDLNIGEYGPYFRCSNCGNINFKKGLEFSEAKVKEVSKTHSSKKHTPKEITVRSDEVDFLY